MYQIIKGHGLENGRRIVSGTDFQAAFKRKDTGKAALAQMNSNDYALPFIADSRKLYRLAFPLRGNPES